MIPPRLSGNFGPYKRADEGGVEGVFANGEWKQQREKGHVCGKDLGLASRCDHSRNDPHPLDAAPRKMAASRGYGLVKILFFQKKWLFDLLFFGI